MRGNITCKDVQPSCSLTCEVYISFFLFFFSFLQVIIKHCIIPRTLVLQLMFAANKKHNFLHDSPTIIPRYSTFVGTGNLRGSVILATP